MLVIQNISEPLRKFDAIIKRLTHQCRSQNSFRPISCTAPTLVLKNVCSGNIKMSPGLSDPEKNPPAMPSGAESSFLNRLQVHGSSDVVDIGPHSQEATGSFVSSDVELSFIDRKVLQYQETGKDARFTDFPETQKVRAFVWCQSIPGSLE